MKAIIYNISQETKISLALLNRKRHKITIITDPLSEKNVHFSEGKDAIIGDETSFSQSMLARLNSMVVKYMILRSMESLMTQMTNFELNGSKYSMIESGDPGSEALQIITILDECQTESVK